MAKRWALIAGAKRSGKSSLASRVVSELASRGIRVGGVIQDALHEEGERVGFRARRVGSSEEGILLARRGVPPPGATPESAREFCSYVFDNEAFAEAGSWVRQAARESDVVVVDEVSKLEVARGGHHDAICDALRDGALVILVVRADQLFAVVERFELDDAVASLDTADKSELESFVAAVAKSARAEGEP